MKILNLYAGIGGNRKFWDKEHTNLDLEITAIEIDPKIAEIYKDFFPQDNVVVADAHQYLLDHFKEFDFIWSSPPCPTHSRINELFVQGGVNPIRYPDMGLYQEIILLKYHFKGKFCIENVISYYDPLIKPFEIDNHYFWANFFIGHFPKGCREHYGGREALKNKKGFDIEGYSGINKTQVLRNCVVPALGLHILLESQKDLYPELFNKNDLTFSSNKTEK